MGKLWKFISFAYRLQGREDAAMATRNQGGWYNSMVWECYLAGFERKKYEERDGKEMEGVLKVEIRLPNPFETRVAGCCHLHWHDKARICFTLVKARAADL